jgi:hypothetical protein
MYDLLCFLPLRSAGVELHDDDGSVPNDKPLVRVVMAAWERYRTSRHALRMGTTPSPATM